jgi:uncharacterized protein YdaT
MWLLVLLLLPMMRLCVCCWWRRAIAFSSSISVPLFTALGIGAPSSASHTGAICIQRVARRGNMSANLFRQALGDGRWQRWRRRNRGPSSKSPTTITGCCCFEHLLLFDRQAPISSTAFDLCLSTMDVSMATGAAAAAGTAADPPPPAASNAGIPPSSPPEDPLAVKQRLWLAEKEAFDSWREPVVRQIAAKSNLERKARSRVAEYRRTIAIAQAEAREWQKKLEEAELDKKEAEETLQSKHALVKQKELQYQITKAERDRRIAAKVQKDQERAELQAKLAQLDAECEERNRAVEDHKRPRDGHGEDTRPAHVAQRRRISGISQDSQSEIAASLADLAAGGGPGLQWTQKSLLVRV